MNFGRWGRREGENRVWSCGLLGYESLILYKFKELMPSGITPGLSSVAPSLTSASSVSSMNVARVRRRTSGIGGMARVTLPALTVCGFVIGVRRKDI